MMKNSIRASPANITSPKRRPREDRYRQASQHLLVSQSVRIDGSRILVPTSGSALMSPGRGAIPAGTGVVLWVVTLRLGHAIVFGAYHHVWWRPPRGLSIRLFTRRWAEIGKSGEKNRCVLCLRYDCAGQTDADPGRRHRDPATALSIHEQAREKTARSSSEAVRVTDRWARSIRVDDFGSRSGARRPAGPVTRSWHAGLPPRAPVGWRPAPPGRLAT